MQYLERRGGCPLSGVGGVSSMPRVETRCEEKPGLPREATMPEWMDGTKSKEHSIRAEAPS